MEELKRSGNRRINCRGRNPLIFLLKVHRCGNRASRMEGQCSAHLSDFIAVEAGGEVCCSGPKNMNLVGGQTLTPLKESYDQPRQHVQNQRHYFAKAMIFPVGMYGCESWTVKKAELQRIDAFGLWCWIRLLRVPWTARRSN